MPDAGMAADRGLRMGIEEIRLDLQLSGRCPIIVAFQQREVVALGSEENLAGILTRANVAFPQVGADNLGILPAVLPHDFARTVRRTVLPDDELVREIDLRSEEHTSELQSPCNFVCRLLLEKN